MQNGWDTELSSRISAWRRTLDFSSPQVHLLPKPSAPAEYEKDYSQVERITAPLMGKRSMYSRTLEHGENEFNEELGKNERLAAQDMANEWMKFGGMSLLDFGMLPFPSVMLPYINFGRLAGFIENKTPGLSIGYPKTLHNAANLHDVFIDRSADVAESIYSLGANSFAIEDAAKAVAFCKHKKCAPGELEAAAARPLLPASAGRKVGEQSAAGRFGQVASSVMTKFDATDYGESHGVLHRDTGPRA